MRLHGQRAVAVIQFQRSARGEFAGQQFPGQQRGDLGCGEVGQVGAVVTLGRDVQDLPDRVSVFRVTHSGVVVERADDENELVTTLNRSGSPARKRIAEKPRRAEGVASRGKAGQPAPIGVVAEHGRIPSNDSSPSRVGVFQV